MDPGGSERTGQERGYAVDAEVIAENAEEIGAPKARQGNLLAVREIRGTIPTHRAFRRAG
jgi:hypothetical protein